MLNKKLDMGMVRQAPKLKGKLSIVIPTALENDEFLAGTLTSITKTTQHEDYEVIVVLNGDQPKSKAFAETHGARVVQLSENMGFSVAMNRGFEAATGDYIVAMNDDVILPIGWDMMLRETVDTWHLGSDMPKAGIVGPVSNYAGGMQNVGDLPPQVNPYTYGEYTEKWKEQNAGQAFPAYFISGFLFMFSREFYQERLIEDGFFFDEETFGMGGAEDNDLSVRTIRAGWTPVVRADCLVWHFGSVTARKMELSTMTDLTNLYKKWQDKDAEVEDRLGGLIRVKLQTADHLADMMDTVRNVLTFCDKVYMLDDNSDAELWSAFEDEFAKFDISVFAESKGSTRNEGEQRQHLYEMAEKDGCTWVISVDADEVFEDKFDRAYAERLMSPPSPHIMTYMFHWYHLWNNEEYWRSDGNRGGTRGMRMQRVTPGFKIPSRKFHVGNVPHLPKGCERTTSVRIKHTGHMRKDERERKYEWYTKEDPNPNPDLVGAADYKHVKSETNVQILPWQERNSIGCTTIMKDEVNMLHNYLNQYWAFFDEFVLVDTGSTDGSVELSKLWGIDVIEDFWDDDFARARNVGINVMQSDWVMQIDIDEDVPELWQVRRMAELPDIDSWMFVIQNLMPGGRPPANSETIRLYRNMEGLSYTGKDHETIDDFIKANKISVAPATFQMVHKGFMKDPKFVVGKLSNYFRINLRGIIETPKDARPYFNAAIHCIECGMREIGGWMLKRSVHLDPNFVQARMELANFELEEAERNYRKITKMLPPQHHLGQIVAAQLRSLGPSIEPRNPIDTEHAIHVANEPEFAALMQQLEKVTKVTEGGIGVNVNGVSKSSKPRNSPSTL